MDVGGGKLVRVAFVYHIGQVSEMFAHDGSALVHYEVVLLDDVPEELGVALDVLEEGLELERDLRLLRLLRLLVRRGVLRYYQQARVRTRTPREVTRFCVLGSYFLDQPLLCLFYFHTEHIHLLSYPVLLFELCLDLF